MPASQNRDIANAWVNAFNAHNVGALVNLYSDDCLHTSPKLRAQAHSMDGYIRGKEALTSWWEGAMRSLPSLRYKLTTLTADDDRVFIEYTRHCEGQAPMEVAEVFDIADGKIVASRVFHG